MLNNDSLCLSNFCLLQSCLSDYSFIGYIQTLSYSGTPQYPQHKRGSSASLSQVEDAMFKQTPSPSSMARLETTNDRFAHSIPYEQEDSPMNGNVAKFSTLPNLKAKGKKISKQVSGSSILYSSRLSCRYIMQICSIIFFILLIK